MNSEEERREIANVQPQRVVYGVVNGSLIRKTDFTITSYPELHDYIRRMVELLEQVYTNGFQLGKEVGEEHGSRCVVLDNKLPREREDPDTTNSY